MKLKEMSHPETMLEILLQRFFGCDVFSLQATDASEASEGEVEKQLRATDRV